MLYNLFPARVATFSNFLNASFRFLFLFGCLDFIILDEIDPSVRGKILLLRQMVSKVFHSEHDMSSFVLLLLVIGMKSKGTRR